MMRGRETRQASDPFLPKNFTQQERMNFFFYSQAHELDEQVLKNTQKKFYLGQVASTKKKTSVCIKKKLKEKHFVQTWYIKSH